MTKPPQKHARRTVTLRDVARETGVSISTVSIVLNQSRLSKNLSVQTRIRVEEAARRLGYTPDPVARSLKNRHSQTVGVMIFDITDPYCTRLLKGIEGALVKTQFLPLIMSVQNKADIFHRYWKLLHERRIEGLIIVPNWATLSAEKVIEGLQQVPCVVIGSAHSRDHMSCITIDNAGGGTKALAHLYELGHRAIAVLRGPENILASRLRWRGIQKFSKDAGLHLDPAICMEMRALPDASSTFEEGYRLTSELLSTQHPFTALLAFDDLAAAGAIRAFHDLGRSVPRDCSVIGFDDIPHAQLISPSLTTMRQPLEQMGAMSVETLLMHIQAKDEGKIHKAVSQMLEVELLVRRSTTPRE
jgi:LacI family transcriptional regulator